MPYTFNPLLSIGLDYFNEGTVTGPSPATDDAIARYDGVTGRIIQDSGVTILDDPAMFIGAADPLRVHGVDLAPRLAVNSNPTTPTAQTIQELQTHNDTAGIGSVFYGARTRGTLASQSVVQNGDVIRTDAAVGHDGTDFELVGYTQWSVDGTPGNDDMPGKYVIAVTQDGAFTPTVAFTINSALNVGIGVAPTLGKLHVVGDANQVGVYGVGETGVYGYMAESDGFGVVGDATAGGSGTAGVKGMGQHYGGWFTSSAYYSLLVEPTSGGSGALFNAASGSGDMLTLASQSGHTGKAIVISMANSGQNIIIGDGSSTTALYVEGDIVDFQDGLNLDGILTLDGASGTAGQVLTSNGNGVDPTWEDVAVNTIVEPDLGGTGEDSSGWTGTPKVVSGVWSSVTPVADNTYTFDTGALNTRIDITTESGIITAISIT